MDIQELHKLIDDWAAKQPKVTISTASEASVEVSPEDKPEKADGQRVVRTKTSGDRVYLLDEEKKTRQWVTNPDVLRSYGFEAADVSEVDDTELLKYNMAPALYKVK